jgi:hypothetical protein
MADFKDLTDDELRAKCDLAMKPKGVTAKPCFDRTPQ